MGDGVAGGPKVDSLRELRPKVEDDPNEESNPEAPNPEEPSPIEELMLGLRVFSLPPLDTAL